MQHDGKRSATERLAEHVEHVAETVAGVHDQGQPGLLREPHVPGEEVSLQVAGGRVPIPVETGLAHGVDPP